MGFGVDLGVGVEIGMCVGLLTCGGRVLVAAVESTGGLTPWMPEIFCIV